MISRTAAVACAGLLHSRFQNLISAPSERRYKIGACDWSIGKMSDPSGMKLAREIGLDGLQVSLGTASNDMHLRRPEIQRAYQEAAREHNVEIASLAIGELNRIPYKNDPRTIDWVRDSIDVCRTLGVRIVLLAFFGDGDLRNDPEGTEEVVRRLKAVAPKAEEAGVILGLESWLSAEEHVAILDRVQSPAVQVYYDVANSHKMGYDIYREIRWLGRSRICEVHTKENGHLLGQGEIDFRKVREAIEEIDYRGWLQIEGAVPKGGAVVESYIKNQKFLRKVFDA